MIISLRQNIILFLLLFSITIIIITKKTHSSVIIDSTKGSWVCVCFFSLQNLSGFFSLFFSILQTWLIKLFSLFFNNFFYEKKLFFFSFMKNFIETIFFLYFCFKSVKPLKMKSIKFNEKNMWKKFFFIKFYGRYLLFFSVCVCSVEKKKEKMTKKINFFVVVVV